MKPMNFPGRRLKRRQEAEQRKQYRLAKLKDATRKEEKANANSPTPRH